MRALELFGVDLKEYTADELEAVERFYRTVGESLKRKQPHWIGCDHYQLMMDELKFAVNERSRK